MARKFFYVCAGMLMLALSYHLGASTSSAQGGAVIEGGSIQTVQDNTFPRATACVNRIWRWMGESGGAPIEYPFPVPGTSRIVATDPNGLVLLENGDWYKGSSGGWTLIGNLAGGGPTQALRESWGQVKSRYRTTPTATPGMTVTPGADKR